MEKLVSYMVDRPEPDADARREFKYPYLACEIFCCELDAVFATLCDNDCELFGRVVRFIDTNEELNPMLCSYFGKVVGCVVSRRSQETTKFFQKNTKFLELLVKKIGSLAVAEVLLRLVGADDPGVSPMQGMLMSAIHGSDQTGWLAETKLLDMLLDALGEETSESEDNDDSATRRANAAEVLVGIARGAPSALGDRLATSNAMDKLFTKGLGASEPSQSEPSPGDYYGSRADGDSGANDVDPSGTTPALPATAHSGLNASPLVNVIDIAIAVLDSKRAAGPAQAMQAFLAAETGEQPLPPRLPPPAAIVACTSALPKLVSFLDSTFDTSTQKTTWGEMTPPLGLKRVKVVDLVATLVCTRDEKVIEQLFSTNALPKCVELFKLYPFNNFLHHHCERFIRDILEWGEPRMLSHLFAEENAGGCDVVGLVACAQQTVSTARGPARSGNLGHVTRLSNVLSGIASGARVEEVEAGCGGGGGEGGKEDEKSSTSSISSVTRARNAMAFVAQKLESDTRWATYAENTLQKRNALENIRSWRCGRPAGMDDDMDDDALSGDDERDFDLGLGAGFSRDAYNRYGGGLEGDDDSDEDDPLDHDSEEDENEDEESVHQRKLAAGLFQGDAGARLASLTLSNGAEDDVNSSDDDSSSDPLFDENAPTVPVPSFAAVNQNDDDVLLGSDDDEDKAESTTQESVDEIPVEFGSVQFWGASIDTSLVPDDL